MARSLQAVFADGTLVRPSDHRANVVHLVRALAQRTGVVDVELSAPTQSLLDLIRPADHVIFILIDGLGMNLVRRLPSDSFIGSQFKTQLTSICPSTTACVLTSVATTRYPTEHAIAGWFTYLPDRDLSILPLPFVERFTNESLVRRGMLARDVFPLASITPRMSTHRPLHVLPAQIAGSTYSLWSCGDGHFSGYTSIGQAFKRIAQRVLQADGPTYTYLYLPEVDNLEHPLGTAHPQVMELVLSIDGELRRLADAVGGRGARIVVTADHGLIDVPRASQILLKRGDPMLDLLQVPPTGDARMPVFHVKPGRRDAFVEMFHRRAADSMVLLTIAQVEAMELLGPGMLSKLARSRFGDFIAFPIQPVSMGYFPPDKSESELYAGLHAGLSPDEMLVPLCVA
jgi:predicted AlkP superfamily pyrophosphatase or phosphodiesterase